MAFIDGSDTNVIAGDQLKSSVYNLANTTRALAPAVDRYVMADATAGSIVLTVPDPSTVAGVAFLIKRIDFNLTASVKIDTAAGLIDITSAFILGNANEIVAIRSDGNRYNVEFSRTFAVASIGYNNPGSPVTQSIGTTPVIIAAFDTNAFSTTDRIAAQFASSNLNVLNVQNPTQDGYDVTFDITYTFANNVDLLFEIYIGGIATGKATLASGRGSNPIHSMIATIVGVPAPAPTTIDVRVSRLTGGPSDIDTLIANLTAIRIGG